ncbi:PAC2 family protein [Labedella populi]|uniref:PAC2 family protein n=1 Tax=Labedella populi TaxID=2498850 RepID=A0A3S4C2A2_9MICO|nr:PAC2 family protein [Labedella populi]RWZ61321.1 PAC2 family protein [Labedella populi]
MTAEVEAFSRGRVLVVAFEGWNDAGDAATGAVRLLQEQLELVPLASVDPEDYYDYQFTRPTVAANDDGRRVLRWPGASLYGPAVDAGEGPSIYLLLGIEPSRSWKNFTAEVLDAALAVDVTAVVLLGAMLADVPHTRPISIFTTSENPDVRRSLAVERSTYEGPVGILTVISDAAEALGLPTVSVWASVPHYVHNAPSPKAVLALVDKLEELVGVSIDRGELVSDSAEWEQGIDALAEEDDEMATYIQQLEQARDTVESPDASGEAIAQEFERYLRRRGDKPDGRNGDEPWGKG